MKMGAENKRNVIILCVLGVGALYGVYSQFSDSSSSPSAPSTAVKAPVIGAPGMDVEQPTTAPRARVRSEEWRPVVYPKNKEDQVNPASIDPTLQMDLLAKVQAVKPAGADRNLFEFGASKPKEVAVLAKNEPIIKGPNPMGPPDLPPPPQPPGPAPPPPLPALDVKYYGFVTPSRSGRRRGFFLEGDNTLIKAEGEMLTSHYRIVKLEAGSVTVEDIDSKRTRTLQMSEDAS